jgi:formylglycine-generating enzyme required for sulfatase activity
MLFSMLAQMFVTTLPAMGAGEEGSLPVLQGIAEPKKAGESQHFTFSERKGDHYTGQYVYCGKEVPFSADLTSEDGKLILTGVVTLPEPIEPEPFVMTKEGDRGWVLKIFGSEFEMVFKNIPFQGQNYSVPLRQRYDIDMVWIDKGYWIGKYEVTQAQYQAIMGTNPSHSRGTNLPVQNVRWHNAMDFCKRLTAQERAAGRLPSGYEYTLPAATQWEYAARAATVGDYNVDGTELSELAWYNANSGGCIHPVGLKVPNAWGLYDIHGNVWEWTLERAIRGGSYCNGAISCRIADWHGYNPNGSFRDFGFRIALVPVQ